MALGRLCQGTVLSPFVGCREVSAWVQLLRGSKGAGVRGCGVTNRRLTTAGIPKRGVSDTGVGKLILTEGRVGLSDLTTSVHICL